MSSLLINSLQKYSNEIKQIKQKNLNHAKENGTKFYLGNISISDGIKRMGYTEDSAVIKDCIAKYINGDFGDNQHPEDIEINKRTIATGYGDVMGEYIIDGHKIWIKTDLNENTMTTIFLPEEW